MNDSTPLWFITGCSTGLGRALATTLLERGHRAAVTARDPRTVAGRPPTTATGPSPWPSTSRIPLRSPKPSSGPKRSSGGSTSW
ncbi:hypothetical protein [Streptomyces coeruleorubidus]